MPQQEPSQGGQTEHARRQRRQRLDTALHGSPPTARQQGQGGGSHLATEKRPVSRTEQATDSFLRPVVGSSSHTSLNCAGGVGWGQMGKALGHGSKPGRTAKAWGARS